MVSNEVSYGYKKEEYLTYSHSKSNKTLQFARTAA